MVHHALNADLAEVLHSHLALSLQLRFHLALDLELPAVPLRAAR